MGRREKDKVKSRPWKRLLSLILNELGRHWRDLNGSQTSSDLDFYKMALVFSEKKAEWQLWGGWRRRRQTLDTIVVIRREIMVAWT